MRKNPNTHGDHIASCLCCRKCKWQGGPPYSSWTGPGTAGLTCEAGHFGKFDHEGNRKECFTALAVECGDFDPRAVPFPLSTKA